MQHSEKFLAIVKDALTRVREVSVGEALQRADAGAGVLVDVREESEFAAGHVKGAVHIGKGVIERDIEKRFPDPATPLLLYCGGGYRSALAGDTLQRMGYTNVVSVAGGWRAFKEQHPDRTE